MSRLESAAKAHLGPLVRGTPVTLDTFVQPIIAAWVIKTALCVDTTTSRRHVPPTVATTFFRDRLPSDATQVWIGRYEWEHTQMAARFLARVDRNHPTTAGEPTDRAFLKMTLTVGHVLFNVFAPADDGPAVGADMSDVVGALHRIWPVNFTFDWPTGASFDEAAFDAMAVARRR